MFVVEVTHPAVPLFKNKRGNIKNQEELYVGIALACHAEAVRRWDEPYILLSLGRMDSRYSIFSNSSLIDKQEDSSE